MKELVEATPLYIVTKRDLILHGTFVFLILKLIFYKVIDIFLGCCTKDFIIKNYFLIFEKNNF